MSAGHAQIQKVLLEGLELDRYFIYFFWWGGGGGGGGRGVVMSRNSTKWGQSSACQGNAI